MLSDVYCRRMKYRYIIWGIITYLIHFFCWYFVMCFCGVYTNSNLDWLKGAFISLMISFIGIEGILLLLKTIFWNIAKNYSNK